MIYILTNLYFVVGFLTENDPIDILTQTHRYISLTGSTVPSDVRAGLYAMLSTPFLILFMHIHILPLEA